MIGTGRAAVPFADARRSGPLGLWLAAALVGAAIALDGAAARGVNALGGVLWIAAGGGLLRITRTGSERARLFMAAVGLALVLVLWVRPFDLVSTVPAFLIAGMVVAWLARGRRVEAALLIPALWLPVHLVVAVGKAIARSVVDGAPAMRTDPPPTGAVVPLAMVGAAALGGLIVGWWREREAIVSTDRGAGGGAGREDRLDARRVAMARESET